MTVVAQHATIIPSQSDILLHPNILKIINENNMYDGDNKCFHIVRYMQHKRAESFHHTTIIFDLLQTKIPHK